ncbi:MAG: hypothetical protein AAB906_02270 [Patescibacteria group bacterium]
MGCINQNQPCVFAGACKVNGVVHIDARSIRIIAIYLLGAGVSDGYAKYLKGNLEAVIHKHQGSQGFDKCFAGP